jgi:hypothetical protein
MMAFALPRFGPFSPELPNKKLLEQRIVTGIILFGVPKLVGAVVVGWQKILRNSSSLAKPSASLRFVARRLGVYVDRNTSLRKAELFGVLERLCERLEPSATQLGRAKNCYESVGQWLADADNEWLASSSIYLQGSTALGTTVKPIGHNEYDVDLISHLARLGSWLLPAMCKQLVGDRLKQHEWYNRMLEEKPRCWRLNYANEFHMDITPSVPNAACVNGGELVPDKALQCAGRCHGVP